MLGFWFIYIPNRVSWLILSCITKGSFTTRRWIMKVCHSNVRGVRRSYIFLEISLWFLNIGSKPMVVVRIESITKWMTKRSFQVDHKSKMWKLGIGSTTKFIRSQWVTYSSIHVAFSHSSCSPYFILSPSTFYMLVSVISHAFGIRDTCFSLREISCPIIYILYVDRFPFHPFYILMRVHMKFMANAIIICHLDQNLLLRALLNLIMGEVWVPFTLPKFPKFLKFINHISRKILSRVNMILLLVYNYPWMFFI